MCRMLEEMRNETALETALKTTKEFACPPPDYQGEGYPGRDCGDYQTATGRNKSFKGNTADLMYTEMLGFVIQ